MDGWSWDDDAVEADTQAVPISITTDKLQGVPDDFNVKGGDNDVCIKIQKSGQKRILLERLVSSTLVAQFAPRYKDQLENWVPAAPAGPPRNKRQKLVDEARQLKTITVITKDEADVPIVDHCLAFLYGIQPPPLTARQLLRLHRMADYLSMVDVLDASMERILALQPSDIGIPDCIWMGYSSELPDDPKIADALRTLGKGGVFHHLHDMPAIMRDEQLKAQWLALPHAALLDLLRNPAFATDSEDSVLTACGMWADQYKLNKPQVRAVLDEVRLVQLSSTFLFTVLPQMDWVREHMLAAVEVMRVAGYADGDAFERKLLQNEAVLPILPAAWIRHDLRPPSSVDSHTPQQGAYFRWSIARDDIEAKMRHDAGQLISVLRMPKSLFTHGLIVTPSIRLGLQENQIGVYISVRLPVRLRATKPRIEPAWRLKATLIIGLANKKTIAGRFDGGNHVLTKDWGFPNFYHFKDGWMEQGQAMMDMMQWDAQLLQDGKLEVTVRVKGTDMLVLPAKDRLDHQLGPLLLT